MIKDIIRHLKVRVEDTICNARENHGDGKYKTGFEIQRVE